MCFWSLECTIRATIGVFFLHERVKQNQRYLNELLVIDLKQRTCDHIKKQTSTSAIDSNDGFNKISIILPTIQGTPLAGVNKKPVISKTSILGILFNNAIPKII